MKISATHKGSYFKTTAVGYS